MKLCKKAGCNNRSATNTYCALHLPQKKVPPVLPKKLLVRGWYRGEGWGCAMAYWDGEVFHSFHTRTVAPVELYYDTAVEGFVPHELIL